MQKAGGNVKGKINGVEWKAGGRVRRERLEGVWRERPEGEYAGKDQMEGMAGKTRV